MNINLDYLNSPIIRCEECGGSNHPLSSQFCICKREQRKKDWVSYFRNIAKVVATKSKDTNTKIGAVIVGEDNEIVSTGYNSFPRGLNDNVDERFERPEKYFWFEHAERNAIYNAARIGSSTKGCTLFIDHWFPCTDCARGIINAGITIIYCEEMDVDEKNKKYAESFVRAKEMLIECGVEIRYYEK